MLEQFDPEPQAADGNGLGVDVHAEEPLFDQGPLLVEEGLLEALQRLDRMAVFVEAVGEGSLVVPVRDE
jgi:hypothetical protein